MARETIIRDDLDGSVGDVETIFFMVGGVYYEIDLTPENTKKMLRAIKPYIDKGRETTRLRANAQSRAQSDGTGEDDLNKRMREWARENGWPDLKDRGRMPQDAVDAYNKAHDDSDKS